MRDYIIVAVAALIALVVIDAIWFGGRYFGQAKNELGYSWSSVNRR